MQIAEEDARIADARAESGRGEFVTAEEIQAEDEAFLARLHMPAEQVAAITAEVEQEADAFYGVSHGIGWYSFPTIIASYPIRMLL